MELIFYCTDTNDLYSGLLDHIGALIREESLVMCQSLEDLKHSLLKPEHDLFAAILVASSQRDLLGLLSLSKLLDSIHVILIISELEQETILLGHSLRPRLLTGPACSFVEVIAVLRKMVGNEKSCQSMLKKNGLSNRRNWHHERKKRTAG